MKTLDEVITVMDHVEFCCTNCKLQFDCDEVECFLEDALHYLKEFQGLSKMWNDKLDKEQTNPPLTWEELQKMVGKPVWVQANHAFIRFTGWALVGSIDDNYPHSIGINLITADPDSNYKPSEFMLLKDFIGNTWQAYRKERNEQ